MQQAIDRMMAQRVLFFMVRTLRPIRPRDPPHSPLENRAVPQVTAAYPKPPTRKSGCSRGVALAQTSATRSRPSRERSVMHTCLSLSNVDCHSQVESEVADL